ncbi:unnamed protein product, partial [Mesorhabditis spiculigera]
MRGMPSGALLLALLGALLPYCFAETRTCTQILAAGPGDEAQQQALLLCQLSESSTLLAQLGGLVAEGLDRLMIAHGIADDSEEQQSGDMEKRKHEYLRFGKRKHEYLRFGKRKHEYLRKRVALKMLTPRRSLTALWPPQIRPPFPHF